MKLGKELGYFDEEGNLLSKPGRLLDKAKDLKLFQNRLKLGKEGIPVAEKTLSKLEDLSQKATLIGDIAQILTGKETRLQQRVNDIDGKISNARTFYDTWIKDLDQLQNDLLQLVAEKTGLNNKLDQAGSEIAGLENQVNDFLNRYRLFDEETDCLRGRATITYRFRLVLLHANCACLANANGRQVKKPPLDIKADTYALPSELILRGPSKHFTNYLITEAPPTLQNLMDTAGAYNPLPLGTPKPAFAPALSIRLSSALSKV